MQVLEKQKKSGKDRKNNSPVSNQKTKDSITRRNMTFGYSAPGNEKKDANHRPLPFDFNKISLFSSQAASIQPKLKINAPGDKYEEEADRIAEQVMRMPETKVQRKGNNCEKDEMNEMIQRKPRASQLTPLIKPGFNSGIPTINNSFQNMLNTSKGSGNPLPPASNQFMSKAFGADFSQVRIHDNETSHELNQNIHAKAFTYGSNIYFNRGQYNPDSSAGKKLLAHELTHTIQQGAEIRRQPSNPFGAPPIDYDLITDPVERKLRMETDAKVIMWKDALKRLKNGELTNEDLKNDRLMNRLTGLKSTEVDDLIKKIKEFQKRKDKEKAEASEEDRKKMKNIKTDKIIEWLKVRKVISTPMSDKAKVTYNALNKVENYKLSLKNINITVQKDTSGNAGNITKLSTNFEGSFSWRTAGGKITQLKKNGSNFNPTSLEVKIITKYHDSPDATSAYGKGTTAKDKAEKTTTLRVHEGQHGTDFINFMTNNPLPVDISGGINGKITPKQFKAILEYIKKVGKDTCELTDQSGFSQDKFLKTEAGKKSGIKSCRKP